MLARLALESDTQAIIDLARENCALSTPYLVFSEERVRQTVRAYIDTANPTIFVCEHRREVVGMLVATINEYRHSTGVFVCQEVLFVARGHRGSRAAVLMMRRLIEWAASIGAAEIVGGNDNGFQSERTARFLAHFGFRNAGYSMRRCL